MPFVQPSNASDSDNEHFSVEIHGPKLKRTKKNSQKKIFPRKNSFHPLWMKSHEWKCVKMKRLRWAKEW